MKALLLSRITATMFILGAYVYFTAVLALDVVLTKTDDALLPIQLIKYAAPVCVVLAWLSLINPLIIKPLKECRKSNVPLFKIKKASFEHELRKSFPTTMVWVGWFGVIRIFKIQGFYFIPFKSGTIWDGDKYNVNPLFLTYLQRVRGYKPSANGEFLVKKIARIQ